jgi:predicted membrane-bound spermidine synthase
MAERRMENASFRWIYLLFFVSGFPALIYQIVWQRALFAIYGVNIESVTVVVSAFMLGLGLGSLIGGRISKQPAAPLLLLFGGAELGIAAYGVGSLALFHRVAAFTAGAPAAETGLLSFLLVLVPTILMGATLPLLVAQLVRLSGNVGRSVGMLYFANTLGSAAACFAAALATMRYLGMSGSVAVAVGLNLLVGFTVVVLHFRWRGLARERADAPEAALERATAMPFGVAMALAAVAGFLSLCYEIVWYRLYAFATGGTPQSFAFVLGAFLAGIAFGSLFSRPLCRRAGGDLPRFARWIAALVLGANLLGFAIAPLVALVARHVDYGWTLPLVAAAAGLLGATFPLICHLSVGPDDRAGSRLSYLYLANIIGSAGGSWLVGFILMDLWPLRGIAVFLAVLGVALAAAMFAAGRLRAAEKAAAALLCAGVCAAVVFSARPLFATVYGQLEYLRDYRDPGAQLADVVETRSGVVTVDADGAIFGGGVYDGWMFTDIHETDTVRRPLSLSFIHPDPKEVLIVGMSGGAWSQLIANHPQVEKVTIIEINPGYVQVVRRYPEVAPLLRNPKVELFFDDGRRWMFRNRRRKFDMIVMDTTYHWRAHATNLLSAEFLGLARGMLKPGGILYYNTTFSYEAQRTGATQFPYAFRFGPLLAVSDSPIQLDRERWRRVLLDYRLEGKPILDPSVPEDVGILNDLLSCADTLPGDTYVSEGMETRENILRRTAGMPLVTDDNMIVEWRASGWR